MVLGFFCMYDELMWPQCGMYIRWIFRHVMLFLRDGVLPSEHKLLAHVSCFSSNVSHIVCILAVFIFKYYNLYSCSYIVKPIFGT